MALYAQKQTNPIIQEWFNSVDTNSSGSISSVELQSALINEQGQKFSDKACSMMIEIFDREKKGTINVQQFEQLYSYLNNWMETFHLYDINQTGYIEENELSIVFNKLGFRFSEGFVKLLIERNDVVKKKSINVDQFVVICVQIQKFTDAFKELDLNEDGVITVHFDEFIEIVLNCLV